MRRFLKPALIVLLICSCLTAKGQEKEFREAINKGKGVTGYYRADLSASHITLKKLTDYALKMKYVLRKPRLGSGRQEKYVVSVNFLPNTELSSKEAVLCGLSEADDGTYWVGADWWLLACWLFNDIAESRGSQVVVYHNLDEERYDEKTLTRVGLLCGYVYCGRNAADESCYMTREAMELNMLNALCPSETAFSSMGSGYLYPVDDRGYKGHFQWYDDLRWTGNVSENGLNGSGFAYYADGLRYHAMSGEFKEGKPTGKCEFYSFYLNQLLFHNKVPTPTVVRIHPFRDGLAKCDWYKGRIISDTNYLDEQLRISMQNPEQITASKWSGAKTKVVKDFENGYLTLSQYVPELNMDIEFLVDKNGEYARLTDKSQAAIDEVLNGMVSQYDKYLSKVLTPQNAVHPTASFSKLGYDSSSFPSKQYQEITINKFFKPALDDYKRRNPTKFDKVELASSVNQLFARAAVLEIDKKAEEEVWSRKARTASTKTTETSLFGLVSSDRQAYSSDYIHEDRFVISKRLIDYAIKDIENNPACPADFSKTKDALNVAFEDMEVWWSRVYRNFFEIFNERSERDHRAEMCENCKIDGRRTTFPKGYVEGYSFLFLSTPGESETAGNLSLKNGEDVKWKYIYDDPMVEIEFMGSYSGHIQGRTKAEVVAKLVDQIITECNKKWGDK